MKKIVLLYFTLLALVFSANVYAQTSAIKMNEINSRGTTADPDWIEIYNSSSTAIDISGYKIYDVGGQGGTKTKKAIPANTLLPAKSYYTIVTDDTTSSGFGLSSSGEKVWLEDNSGNIIDTITFAAMSTTQTYGRIPDGGAWKLNDAITKGYANSVIVMNEIWSRGSGTDLDWIEIYNSSSATVDIAGYKIYDAGGQGNTKPKMTLPAGATISAKGFYVVITDVSTSDGFGLSSSGELVWLANKDSVAIDTVTFLGHTVTQTYSRIPDGGAWKVVDALTKGKTNSTTTGIKKEASSISSFKLDQNYPNPFNPSTQISFTIPEESNVSLKVYDLLGKEVSTLINRAMKAGSYNIAFDAKKLTSGIYFYKLQTKDFTQMRKMVLMK